MVLPLPRLLPNGESGLTVSVRSSLYVDDLIGERGGNRTHDPLIKSQMLYLLSYALA